MNDVNELAAYDYGIPAWASYAYATFPSRGRHNNRTFFIARSGYVAELGSERQLAAAIDPEFFPSLREGICVFVMMGQDALYHRGVYQR